MIPGIGHNSVRGLQRFGRTITEAYSFTGDQTDLLVPVNNYGLEQYLAVILSSQNTDQFGSDISDPSFDGLAPEFSYTPRNGYSNDGHRAGFFIKKLNTVNSVVSFTCTETSAGTIYLLTGHKTISVHATGEAAGGVDNITINTATDGIVLVSGIVNNNSLSVTAISNTDRLNHEGASTTHIHGVDDVAAASSTNYAITHAGVIGMTSALSLAVG